MRYPIILLAVVALALPAGTARAQCPNSDTLYAASCRDLPVYGDEIDHGGCSDVVWYFYYTRTSQDTGKCKVIVRIENTSCTPIIIDSDSCSEGSYADSGYCLITGTPIQGTMRHLSLQPSDTLFSDLELIYKIY
jgi:hypothetical protein